MSTLLIDSHCHLHRLAGAANPPSVDAYLARASAVGVAGVLGVAVDLSDVPDLLRIATAHPDHVWVSAGCHPLEVVERGAPSYDDLLRWAALPEVVAVGETGLDFHYVSDQSQLQRDAFRTHLEVARQCRKPVIVHSRSARAETLEDITAAGDANLAGVLHCFTDDWDTARRLLDVGFYISFAGVVTFRNAAALREVATRVPLDRLLVETDSPYLAPVPHRGKPNEPAYLVETARQIADLRGMTLEVFAERTSDNFRRLFGVAPRSVPQPEQQMELAGPKAL